PPTVRFGEEACASCRMIIGDEHFAAALVAPTGDALKFDDIGCLVEHEAGRLRPEVAYWGRDAAGLERLHAPGARGRACPAAAGLEWLDAREARFAHSPSVVSPMGFGLAAHPARRAVGGPNARMLRLHELPGFLAGRLREAGSDLPKSE